MQSGPYPPPRHTIAHLSDPHLITGGYKVYSTVDPAPGFAVALERLRHLITPPEALVFTGDLADLGQKDAYEQLLEMVGPVAEELGAEIIWVMGNHDERPRYSEVLFGSSSDAPQDRVYDCNGLRIIALDSTVNGYHHGQIEPKQIDWLADVLSTPAEHGTLVAMHHPPAPTPMEVSGEVIQLDGQDELAQVLAGTDVRSILAGHLHYSAHTTFAGIPVSVASASCYTIDHAPIGGYFAGVDGNGSFSVVHLYDEGPGGVDGAPVLHSTVPLAEASPVVEYTREAAERIRSLPWAERRELFSKKGKEARAARREWRKKYNL